MISYILFPFRVLHSILSLVVILATTLILLPFLVLAVSINVKHGMYVQWIWSKIFALICGVRLYVEGRENIPKTGAIILFNHSSFLDIPITVLVTRKFMFYVAKKELEKLPVLGWCFKLVKSLMMPRNDREASIALYEEAKKRLAQGDQFVISPEGGRSKIDGISDFKSGPFIFAMSCGADLVPVIIKGVKPLWPSADLLPNLRQSTASIRVKVCPAQSTKDWTENNRKAKMQELKIFFEKEYKSL